MIYWLSLQALKYKKNPKHNTKENKQINWKNKQAKAQSQNRLLAEDETGGCSCSPELLWVWECHQRASFVQLTPIVRCWGARVQKAFPPAEGSSDQQQGWAREAWLHTRDFRKQSISAHLSLHKRVYRLLWNSVQFQLGLGICWLS